jgi:hypothetical protein
MTRATFGIAVALLCTAAARPRAVTIVSPCECRENHGKGRWAVKTDASIPPLNASAIQAVTPSDMFSWLGMDAQLTTQSARTGRENNWYSLTGRVVAVKVEADGDLHIALQDATVTVRRISPEGHRSDSVALWICQRCPSSMNSMYLPVGCLTFTIRGRSSAASPISRKKARNACGGHPGSNGSVLAIIFSSEAKSKASVSFRRDCLYNTQDRTENRAPASATARRLLGVIVSERQPERFYFSSRSECEAHSFVVESIPGNSR